MVGQIRLVEPHEAGDGMDGWMDAGRLLIVKNFREWYGEGEVEGAGSRNMLSGNGGIVEDGADRVRF